MHHTPLGLSRISQRQVLQEASPGWAGCQGQPQDTKLRAAASGQQEERRDACSLSLTYQAAGTTGQRQGGILNQGIVLEIFSNLPLLENLELGDEAKREKEGQFLGRERERGC